MGERVPTPSAKINQIVKNGFITFIEKTILTRLAASNKSAMESKSAPVGEAEPVFLAIVPSIISVNSAIVYSIRNKTEIFLKKSNKIVAKMILKVVKTFAMCFISLVTSFHIDEYFF